MWFPGFPPKRPIPPEPYEEWLVRKNWDNPMGGLPIETCPKDGSEFLAYDPVARKFGVCEWMVARTSNGGWVSLTQSDSLYGSLEDEFQSQRATLWWPLPKVQTTPT